MAKQIPLLAFTISGPMAHFRKFYSSTSALTYSFPPRTALMGLVAGLLGYEKDTYYELLNSKKLWIGVRMCTPVRIRTYTVNYLFTKGNALYSKGQGTQIPMAWVFPRPPYRVLKYRVYLSTTVNELWDKLVNVFSKRIFRWPPYLGVSEAVAWIEEDIWIGKVPYEEHKGPVPVITPIIKDPEMKIIISKNYPVRLMTDSFTLDIQSSPYRSPLKTVEVLYEDEGKPFLINLPYPVFLIPEQSGNGENIYGAFFLEHN